MLPPDDPNSKIEDIDFDFPVGIRKGCWEVFTTEKIISTAVMAVMGIYATSALSTIAANDFKDVSFNRVFKKIFEIAFGATQYTIKIAKHMGEAKTKEFPHAKFKENGQVISILNSKNEYLDVPVEYNGMPSNSI